MKVKLKAKMFIDFLMMVLLLLTAYQVTGEKLHEWLGVFMFLLFIVHNVLNIRWYGNLFRGKQLVIWLVLIHNVFNAVAFPFSGALSNGLRAAGDVKFTMYVSVLSTIVGRLFLYSVRNQGNGRNLK